MYHIQFIALYETKFLLYCISLSYIHIHDIQRALPEKVIKFAYSIISLNVNASLINHVENERIENLCND